MAGLGKQMHQQSLQDKQGFWQQAAEAVTWFTPFEQVLDESNAPFYKWFAGGKMNTCFNAVDRHVEAGHGDRIAIEYVSPVTQNQYSISYQELLSQVSRFAGYM